MVEFRPLGSHVDRLFSVSSASPRLYAELIYKLMIYSRGKVDDILNSG